MKRPETPVEIAFDNWLHDYAHGQVLGAVYEGRPRFFPVITAAEIREMLAAAFDAGWDAGEDA